MQTRTFDPKNSADTEDPIKKAADENTALRDAWSARPTPKTIGFTLDGKEVLDNGLVKGGGELDWNETPFSVLEPNFAEKAIQWYKEQGLTDTPPAVNLYQQKNEAKRQDFQKMFLQLQSTNANQPITLDHTKISDAKNSADIIDPIRKAADENTAFRDALSARPKPKTIGYTKDGKEVLDNGRIKAGELEWNETPFSVLKPNFSEKAIQWYKEQGLTDTPPGVSLQQQQPSEKPTNSFCLIM